MKALKLIVLVVMLATLFSSDASAQRRRRLYRQRIQQQQHAKVAKAIAPNEIPPPTQFLYRHFLARVRKIVDNDTLELRVQVSQHDFADVTVDLYGLVAHQTPECRTWLENWIKENDNKRLVYPFWVSLDPRPLPAGQNYVSAIVPYVIGKFFSDPSMQLNTQMIAAGCADSNGQPVYDGWAEQLYSQ